MNQPATVPGSRLGQEGTAVPRHACDPATLPQVGSWGPAQASSAPGHCSSYGTAVSGNVVLFVSPHPAALLALPCCEELYLQTPAGLGVSVPWGQPGGQRGAAVWQPSHWSHCPPSTGHYPACVLPSKHCKLPMGHGEERWPSTGTDWGGQG